MFLVIGKKVFDNAWRGYMLCYTCLRWFMREDWSCPRNWTEHSLKQSWFVRGLILSLKLNWTQPETIMVWERTDPVPETELNTAWNNHGLWEDWSCPWNWTEHSLKQLWFERGLILSQKLNWTQPETIMDYERTDPVPETELNTAWKNHKRT